MWTARIRRWTDVSAAEATLGYRLRQYHVGLVCCRLTHQQALAAQAVRGGNRQNVELALLASHWLGSYVLRSAPAGGAARTR